MDAATEHDDNKRRMRICNHIDEFLLDSGEIEAGSVVTLAGSCRTYHTAAPCDHNHGNLGMACRIYRFSESGAIITLHGTASGVPHFHAVSKSRVQTRERRDMGCEVRTRSIGCAGMG